MSSTNQHEEFVATVQAYLSGHQSIEQTLEILASPIEAAYVKADTANTGPESASNLLWTLWQAIILVARNVAYDDRDRHHSRLIALFTALKARPTPPISASKLAVVESSIPWALAPIWHNLVTWSWQVRESFDELDPIIWDSRPGAASPAEWVNLNAVLASLTRSWVADHSFLGLSILQISLEEQHTLQIGSLEARNAAVGSIAVWLQMMGDVWAREGWHDPSLGGERKPPRSLWAGPPFIINQKRVQFWMERLDTILRAIEEPDAEWLALVRTAMKKLEAAMPNNADTS